MFVREGGATRATCSSGDSREKSSGRVAEIPCMNTPQEEKKWSVPENLLSVPRYDGFHFLSISDFCESAEET